MPSVNLEDKIWRLLIVDDSSDDRNELRRLLLKGSDKHYHFMEAETGHECIAVCLNSAEGPPDCVLLDYYLPDYEATELMQALGGPECLCCPVLIVTGYAGPLSSAEVLRMGAQDFISKDWLNPYSLTRALENTIERFYLEQTLKDSEARLRLFIEYAPAAIAMFDRQMRYLSTSQRWREDYRITGKFIGLSHYELFPEIPERWKVVHRRGLAGDVVQADEDTFERADGSVQWVRWEVRPWRNAVGEVGGIVIFTEDITTRKRAEEALSHLNTTLEERIVERTLELQASEELNRRTLQALPAHIAVLDRKGCIVNTNHAWDSFAVQNGVYGKPFVALGANYLDACRDAVTEGDENAAQALVGIEAVMTGRQVLFSMEYSCHVQQEQRWFYMTVVPLGAQGEGGSVITHVNVTNLKQAELRLQESDERLELAMAGSDLVLWDWNIPERKVTAGNRWLNLLGYTNEELGNDENDWMNLINPNDLEDFTKKLSAHLQGETASFDSEHRLHHKEGHWVWVEARGKVTRRDKDNTPLRMVGTILDITQRKRLSEEGMDLLKRIELLIRESSSRSPVQAVEDKSADTLTKRQRQILGMIAMGMTSAEIGKLLHLATPTVISHRRNLMAKLNLHSTAEVTRFAIQHGLLASK